MNKPTKKQQEKIDAARIQRAVTGLQIPMMQIPALYKHAETMIAQGADDSALAAGIRSFMAVPVTA